MTSRIGKRAALALMVVAGLAAAVPAQALQCVPYARAASGIDLRGDAWRWWNAAAGVYERGHAPRLGAVMVFRKYGKMRLGHVAVIEHVVNTREVLIDHANWGPRGAKGRVSKMVAVRDVSPRNDWSQVQVWNAITKDYGTRTYPTYGFIYPHGGARLAEAVFSVEMPDDVTALLAAAEASPAAKMDTPAMVTEAVLTSPSPIVESPIIESALMAVASPAAPVTPVVQVARVDYADEASAAPVPSAGGEMYNAPVPGRLKATWDGDHQAAVLAGSGKY